MPADVPDTDTSRCATDIDKGAGRSRLTLFAEGRVLRPPVDSDGFSLSRELRPVAVEGSFP